MGIFTKAPDHESFKARSIVASAKSIDPGNPKDVASVKTNHEKWQDEAWAYFDLIGEIKYATRFVGNSLSRLRIFAATQPDKEETPINVSDASEVPTDPATGDPVEGAEPYISTELAEAAMDELARLRSPVADQSELLRENGENIFIAGEAYLIGLLDKDNLDDEGNPTETFGIYSEGEVSANSEKKLVISESPMRQGQTPDKDDVRVIGDDEFVLRTWRRHSRYGNLADSNIRGVLAECEELLLLHKSIRAAAKSRLSAGILFVPDELSFQSTEPTEGDSSSADEDSFETDLMDSMTEPIEDEGSASSLVPLVVRGPSKFGKDIEHTDLAREIDKTVLDRCNYLLERIGNGIEVPPEIIFGMSNVNHWTAWQIDETTFKAHIEPIAVQILNAWTVGFLRPALKKRLNADGSQQFLDSEINKVMFWYDATNLVAQPNRSDDAKAAHSAMALSNEALLRELNFSADDAPSLDELQLRASLAGATNADLTLILMKLAELVPATAALPTTTPATGSSGNETPDGADAGGDTVSKPPTGASTKPLELTAAIAPRANKFDGVGEKLAAIDHGLRERLLVAADAEMAKVLDKAGARLRSRTSKHSVTKEALRGVSNRFVATTLGPSLVASIDPDGTASDLDGAFDDMQDHYDSWTKRAQLQALKTLGIKDTDKYDSEMSDNRDQGWKVFRDGMVALAGVKLYNPQIDDETKGESLGSMYVSPGLIRSSMSYAGGGQGISNGPKGSAMVDAGTRPAGGVATGDFVSNLFHQVGAVNGGYQWVYGDASSRQRPFEPHEDLDGVEFQNWSDPVLTVTSDGDWLGVDFYQPGDHDGCQCDFAPIVLDVAESDDNESDQEA